MVKRKPVGVIARCQCGEVVGVVDFGRMDSRDAGGVIGGWILAGCKIYPCFERDWSVNLTACKCEEAEDVS